jgi:small subunit ribosomal protein S1
MDWTNKNVYPSKIVQLGDEVEVMILEIDEDRRRISLGMKQCKPNPWDEFSLNHEKGEKVSGQIKSITDFGLFIGLPGNIDGLVHLSDLSWTQPGEKAISEFKKGDEVEAVVLSIDVEKERISLGIKQLEGDPFTIYVASHDKNSIVKGIVKSVDAKGAIITLTDEVEGYLRASEMSRDKIEDIRSQVNEGDEIEAMIINIDRKSRNINLSVKSKMQEEEDKAVKSVTSAPSPAHAGTTNLGALLKAKIDSKASEEQ